MIRFAFTRPLIVQAHDGNWQLLHPSNRAILAYCSSEREALLAASVLVHSIELAHDLGDPT